MRISDWSSDVCSSDLNPANHFSLLSPNQRYLLNVIGHYNLTDNITAFVEGSYAHTSGTKISDLFQFAAPNILGGPVLTMSADNPFISQQARDILIANGASTFKLNRNMKDIADRTPRSEEHTSELQSLM